MCAGLEDCDAWEEFIRRFLAVICAAVLRAGRVYPQFHPGLRDDLVQEVFLKLAAENAKALREFVPRHPGSAFAYLRVIAARAAHDCLRSKGFRPLAELPEDLPDVAGPDPSAHGLLEREIDDCLGRHATPRDRHIFWLHHRIGMTAAEIAAIPAFELTVKGVESVLARLHGLLRRSFGPGERE